MTKTHPEYELLGSHDRHHRHQEEEDDDDDDAGTETDLRIRLAAVAARERQVVGLLCLCLAIFMVALGLFASFFVLEPSELRCHRRISPWSPLWPVVDFWEGDFVNYFNHSTIYRGPPTYEREVAWNDLWHRPGIPVTEDGIRALGKPFPGKYIETVDSDPNNPTYGAITEVFHQLHCLNAIRQYTWPRDHFNKSWGFLYPWVLEEPVGARMHVDHCIETLRLSLMCYADVTPVLLNSDAGRRLGGAADFNTHHKCRDFEKIANWVEDHGVAIRPFHGADAQNDAAHARWIELAT